MLQHRQSGHRKIPESLPHTSHSCSADEPGVAATPLLRAPLEDPAMLGFSNGMLRRPGNAPLQHRQGFGEASLQRQQCPGETTMLHHSTGEGSIAASMIFGSPTMLHRSNGDALVACRCSMEAPVTLNGTRITSLVILTRDVSQHGLRLVHHRLP